MTLSVQGFSGRWKSTRRRRKDPLYREIMDYMERAHSQFPSIELLPRATRLEADRALLESVENIADSFNPRLQNRHHLLEAMVKHADVSLLSDYCEGQFAQPGYLKSAVIDLPPGFHAGVKGVLFRNCPSIHSEALALYRFTEQTLQDYFIGGFDQLRALLEDLPEAGQDWLPRLRPAVLWWRARELNRVTGKRQDESSSWRESAMESTLETASLSLISLIRLGEKNPFERSNLASLEIEDMAASF